MTFQSTRTPSQGHPGAKPAAWLNTRELGRVFDVKGPALLQRMKELGWVNEAGVPSQACVDAGWVKKVTRPVFDRDTQETKREYVGYRWHAQKAVAALVSAGFERMTDRQVFVRATADEVARGLRTLANRVAGNGGPLLLEDSKNHLDWTTQRVLLNLEALPESDRMDFLGALQASLLKQGFKDNNIALVFRCAGLLEAFQAHTLDARWASAPVVLRPRVRM